jgi:hypothetical protein
MKLSHKGLQHVRLTPRPYTLFCTFLSLSPTEKTKTVMLEAVSNRFSLSKQTRQAKVLSAISLGQKEEEKTRRADLKRPASAVQFRP